MVDCRPTPFFDGPEPIVRPWRDYWIVQEPFTYYLSDRGHITVPAGFCTDYASIPMLLWPIIYPTDPRIRAAALIHDRCYESHEVSRAEADFLLWQAMGFVEQPASALLRWHVWAGVRIGGHFSYKSGPRRQMARRQEFEAWQSKLSA